MRGIVLAGGKGSRLRPFTYSGAKQLVPIANTPVLHFPVRQLVAAGITDIAIIVGDNGQQVCTEMGDGARFGARFTYISQPVPLGIAHAVALCSDFVGQERFVVYLGDNVLHSGIETFADAFERGGADAAVILKEVEDPRAFGVAVVEHERLIRIVEKPAEPPSALAVTGIYGFSPSVFPVIERQTPSFRGELEIADTINGVIASGGSVTVVVTSDDWIDTGKMDDILAANRIVLRDLVPSHDPDATILDSTLSGNVSIGADAVIDWCEITGPVVIGAGARLHQCKVGPDVAIGAGCTLDDVRIRNAIVMERAVLRACEGISDSMIGRDAFVSGAPAGVHLTLGDHSRIETDR